MTEISGESTVQRLVGWEYKEHFQAGQEGLFLKAEALLNIEKPFRQVQACDKDMIGTTMREDKDSIKWAKSLLSWKGQGEKLYKVKTQTVLPADREENEEGDEKTNVISIA